MKCLVKKKQINKLVTRKHFIYNHEIKISIVYDNCSTQRASTCKLNANVITAYDKLVTIRHIVGNIATTAPK